MGGLRKKTAEGDKWYLGGAAGVENGKGSKDSECGKGTESITMEGGRTGGEFWALAVRSVPQAGIHGRGVARRTPGRGQRTQKASGGGSKRRGGPVR